MKNHIIHARLDDQTYKELEFLKKDFGIEETTEMVTLALHLLFLEKTSARRQKTAFEVLDELGLIGSSQGPSDLSETYKKRVQKSFKDKHAVGKPKREK